FGQVMNDINQVPQIPAQPVELPHDQGVPVTQRFQASSQLGPVILLPRGPVLVERIRTDASSQERISLQVGRLGTVRLRDAHVSDQHRFSLCYLYVRLSDNRNL